MTGEKGAAHRISYRHHKILVKIACLVLIIVAGFTVGINLVLLHETHQTIIAKTDRHISELSASVSNSLVQRFQRTLRILESVELSMIKMVYYHPQSWNVCMRGPACSNSSILHLFRQMVRLSVPMVFHERFPNRTGL